MKTRIQIVLALSLWWAKADCQLVPSSPCPDVFRYETEGQKIYGSIRYQPPGPQKTIVVRANFSIKATLPSNYIGQLEVMGPKQQVLQNVLRGSPLQYRVHFPLASPLPRITGLTINGQILCYGSPEYPGPGEAVTSLSLDHMLYADGDASAGPAAPAQPPFGFVAQPVRPGFGAPSDNPSPTVYLEDGNRLQPEGFVVDLDTKVPTLAVDPASVAGLPNQQQPSVSQRFPSPPYYQPQPTGGGGSPQANVQSQQRPPVPLVPTELPAPTAPPTPPRTTSAPSPPVDEGPVECGVAAGASDRVALVFHGNAVAHGDWPWLVALYVRRESGLQFTCAGSLISEQHVITAAHCMHHRSTLTAMRDLVLRAGAHDLDDWSDDSVVTRSLRAADIHFSYDPRTLENDILMLTLDKPVAFSSFIRPVCLWEGSTKLDLIVGQGGTVVGWGGNELGPSGHGEPRMATLPVVSTDTCRASRVEFHKLTSSNTLCAGDRNGSGPCNGDSGGGLYVLAGGRWRLRGVVSVSLRPVTGEAVCNLDEYLVFTDVAQYLPWLRDLLDRKLNRRRRRRLPRGNALL